MIKLFISGSIYLYSICLENVDRSKLTKSISIRSEKDSKMIKSFSAALFLAVFAPVAAFGATVISDTEFVDINWSAAEIGDTTPNNSFVFSGAQVLNGGDPGAFRTIVSQVNTLAASSVQAAHIYEAATYDPSGMGAIGSLTFSLDLKAFSGPAGAMGAGAVVRQGGNFFAFGLGQVLNGSGWVGLTTGPLSSAQFTAISGGTLDFSGTGGVMSFGFLTSNGTFGTPSTNTAGFDNFRVEIAQVGAVPLPAGMFLLLTTLVGFGVASRWSRRF
ncbi:VPLPA-CTERM sorting domain-containing protein [Roseibium album]|uniref:VPLPA-CTERM sorting domain-containing protein n=1 Tax=Roseibium album TaxID=311410 RepID=UPI002492016F|nr:VPLPA-CTERM sorting domain-containing protein [Roseibium album]